MQRFSWLLAASLVLPALTGTARAQSDEFRIDTDVLLGNEKQPFAESVTVFTAGLVYDFPLMGPAEITVFDPARGRFVLLDPERQMKTTLTTQELLEFTAAIKVEAQERGGVFAAAADSEFEEQADDGEGWLTLKGRLLAYRAKGQQPQSPSMAASYHDFADWYARLNATRPGSLPPFARIELNRALAHQGLIPEEVELTVSSPNRLLGRKTTIRSRHLPCWSLSNTDRKRIDTAGTYMAKFQAVSFQEYRQPVSEKR